MQQLQLQQPVQAMPRGRATSKLKRPTPLNATKIRFNMQHVKRAICDEPHTHEVPRWFAPPPLPTCMQIVGISIHEAGLMRIAACEKVSGPLQAVVVYSCIAAGPRAGVTS
jgi:hypothetical protein